MKINFRLKPTKSQEKALSLIDEEDTRYLVCNWARQTGKSTFAEIMLITYLAKPRTFSAYISPTFSQGRKIFRDITRMLDNKGLIKTANATTLTIDTVIGSTLQFFSMDSPNAIRGNTISGILVLDEAAFFPDQLPDGTDPFSSIIFPITKARKPKTIIISTPKGKRGMFYSLYNKALAGENGFKYIKTTIYDDDLITKEEIEELKKIVNPISFSEEFECEFLDSSLTFFKGFEHCFYSDFQYDTSRPQYIGIDLSANGEDETILTLINGDMRIKQLDISGSLDEKYRKIAGIINGTKNLKSVYVENNGIGAPMINEIKKLITKKGIITEWQTTNSSKSDIVCDLAVRIANKEIYFNEEDKGLYSQLGTFAAKFTKTGKMTFEASGTAHDDRVLSLAIALRCKQDCTRVGKYKFGLNNF